MGKKRKDAATASTEKKEPLVDLSEEDQWRIIRESGVLKKIVPETKEEPQEEQLLSPFTEEVFAALALIIPHCALLLMMEILVHYQYGRKPTYEELVDRMLPGTPIIAIFVFYTNRYKHNRRMQFAFFIMACLCGSRLIYMINWANWRENMKMLPPLATAWIYATAQCDLGPAVLSLVVIGSAVWYKGWKLSL